MWIYDPGVRSAPYDHKEIFKGWNCIASNKSNGLDIIKWRWKPKGCDLPRFDPVRFLERFRNTNDGTLFYLKKEGGWCSRVARGGYGVGVWKAIRKEWEGIRCRSRFIVGNGRKVKFWKDSWCKDQTLKEAFPNLYRLAVNKDEWVSNAWEGSGESGCWNPHFSRHFNDWELEEVESLL
uniref:Trichome birefringence-like N-terminal domain-containing protein n=1 Tax=Vitis vinifera TaxID=29760 RepID=A5AXQ3_VITVI|nr:hypothetical protein VITISV_018196 [Vitis vinifera]